MASRRATPTGAVRQRGCCVAVWLTLSGMTTNEGVLLLPLLLHTLLILQYYELLRMNVIAPPLLLLLCCIRHTGTAYCIPDISTDLLLQVLRRALIFYSAELQNAQSTAYLKPGMSCQHHIATARRRQRRLTLSKTQKSVPSTGTQVQST